MIWREPAAVRCGHRSSFRGAVGCLAALVAVCLPLLSCGGAPGGGSDDGFRLTDLVGEGRFASPGAPELQEAHGLSLPGLPELASFEVDHERRQSVLLPAGAWSWTGVVPPGGRLNVSVQTREEDWPPVGLTLRLEVRQGGHREIVATERITERRWLNAGANLGRWAGQKVEIRAEARPSSGDWSSPDPRLAWSWSALSSAAPPGSGPAAGAEPPNIVFILVDTLRADRLTPYGAERPTSPEIEARLADRGVLFESAYAPAPWTLPSMVGLFSGRYPGAVLRGPMSSYRLPDAAVTLAERIQAAGYETGAFFGNFLLRDGNGFGRGFATRYTPPPGAASNTLHADQLNRRVLPWLQAHRDRPFFLYVHYMDPHDPYVNSDLVGGRSPFDPDYRGEISGWSVHGVYNGRIELTDPEADTRQLRALYDSEVRYVDRFIGELIASLPPEVARETLFVLTADHGEELGDHGGWKHGQSLYDEQVRIPLILRWDGRLPAGERLPGTVRLIDLPPTLATLVGFEADPGWHGVDLAPALRGEESVPRRPAFLESLASGPLRAAAVLERKKLILFNREEPFEPNGDLLIAHLWKTDLARFAHREAYDLAADPGESRNEVGRLGGVEESLERVIHHRLDQGLGELRALAGRLPAGGVLSGRLRFERPPTGWRPMFLGPRDEILLEGRSIRFRIQGSAPGEPDGLEKGFLVEGDLGALLAAEARLDGAPLPPERLLVGAGRPYDGASLGATSLLVDRRPALPDGPSFRIWLREPVDGMTGGAANSEIEESLRALGYVQ